jgi:tetratricopeptide (TPR) repeat protein
MHRYEEALESFRKGLAIMQGITPQAPSNTQWQADLATSFYKVGETLSMLRRYDEALEMSKKNVQLLAQLAQGDEVNSYWQHELSESYGVLGHALKDIGRVDDAVEAYRKALTVIDKLVASEPSNATWTSTLVTILFYLADVGDNPRANLTRGLELLRRLTADGKLPAYQKTWEQGFEQLLARLPPGVEKERY